MPETEKKAPDFFLSNQNEDMNSIKDYADMSDRNFIMDAKKLHKIFDAVPENNLSEETKSACRKASDYFGELIHKNEENIFSSMASDNMMSLSQLLKFSIPGVQTCDTIEQIRKSIFNGASTKEIASLYFDTIAETCSYLDLVDMSKKITAEEMVSVVIGFYETYGKSCFDIDEELYNKVKKGETKYFRRFFNEYLKKYREQMKEIMFVSSFGAERNIDATYRKTMYYYIELLLCYVVFSAKIYEISADSFERFTEGLTEDIVCNKESFYQFWLKINNEVINEAYADGEYAGYLFDTANVYHKMLAESKKLYENNLGNAPLAKESDMRELYKTVHELRKEIAELKKELKEVKGC